MGSLAPSAQLMTMRKMLHPCSPRNDFHSVPSYFHVLFKGSPNGRNSIIEQIFPFNTVCLSTPSRELHQSYFAISFKEKSWLVNF